MVWLEGGWDAVPVRTSRSVDLAAGTRKELMFYLGPAEYAHDFEIRLRRQDGELLGETLQSSVAVSADRPAVGIFGRHPLGWGTLREAGHFDGVVAQLDAATLPDFAAALDVFDILVWTRPEPRRLRPEQVWALSRWIAAGGRLVLTAAEVPPGEEIAPWTLVRTAELKAVHQLRLQTRLDSYPTERWPQPLAVARLDAAAAGDSGAVVITEDWGPAAVLERRGLGMVIVLGFDPGDPRLAGWPGLGNLWRRLATVGEASIPAIATDPVHQGNDFVLRAMALAVLGQDSGGSPPPRRTLVLVLLLYLAAIGPGEYLLLKRWRRLTWTWVTFPIWVLLFSFGAYAAATASRTDVAAVRHLLIRDLWPGVDAEELFASYYVPRAGRYLLSPRWPRGLTLAGDSVYGEEALSYYRQNRARSEKELQKLVPVAGQGEVGVAARRPKWSYLTASFLRETAPAGTVEVAADWRDGALAGRITPRLGVDLAGAWIVASEDGVPVRWDLGRLTDGRTRYLEGFTSRPVALPERLGWGYGDPPSRVAEVLTAMTAWRLLLSALPSEAFEDRYAAWNTTFTADDAERDWSELLAAGGAAFLAWAEDPEPRLDAGAGDVESRGIVVFRMPWISPGDSR